MKKHELIFELLNKNHYITARNEINKLIAFDGEKPWLSNLLVKNRLSSSISDETKSELEHLVISNNNIFKGFASKIENYISTTVQAPKKIQYKKPKDTEHYYIYNQNLFITPENKLITLNNSTLSIDFEKPYKTDYYFFDENNKYLEEISSGDTPFILDDGSYIIDKNIAFIEDRSKYGTKLC